MIENVKIELTKEEIHFFLKEINDRLASLGLNGEIRMVGGAALSLAFDARDFTRDVDAVFSPVDEIRNIVEDLAEQFNLEEDWLNNNVATYITDKIIFKPFLEFSNLKVTCADAESLLAMKLTAARVNTLKDMNDCVFLMKYLNIKSETELIGILDNHVDPFLRKLNVKFFLKEAYEIYANEIKKGEYE